MLYEWDDNKAAANLARHGVAFDEMKRFDWSTARVLEDTRRDYGETRYIAIGCIGARLHVVVFTIRAERIRIIGLRKANPRVNRYGR